MKRLIFGLAFLSCVGSAGRASADFSPALDFGSGTGTTYTTAIFNGFTVGSSFTVGSQDFVVDALGTLSPYAIAGGRVKIYDASTTDLANVTFNGTESASTATGQGHQYQYIAIAPITLSANTTYYVAEDLLYQQTVVQGATGLSLDPAITFNGAVSSNDAGGHPFSDQRAGQPDHITGGAYFGPTFEGHLRTVPEPGSFALMGVGLAGIAAAAVRKRKRGKNA